MPEPDLQAAYRYIDARGFGIRPDLGRIEALVAMLDHPQRRYPVVHIAGTNGKSSTARMVAAILAANGLNTGLYTSPHLQSLRERFMLVGAGQEPTDESERGLALSWDLITPQEFVSTLEYLKPYVETVEADRRESVTYFELTSALGFEWMSEKAVQAAVFETGMGGHFDATNVVIGEVAVLTPIDVDHVSYLGPTAVDNAREKVGIIKRGASVVSADQTDDVDEVIRAAAAEKSAELVWEGLDFKLEADELAVGGRLISVKGALGIYENIFVPLLGPHQARNATLAIAASEQFLGRSIDNELLSAALASVRSPGRMEIVEHRPLVILDGAHNPQGARVLGPALAEAFGDRPITFVVAIFEDKDVLGILGALQPFASNVFFTTSGGPRSAKPEVLAKLGATIGMAGDVALSLPEAIGAAKGSAGAEGIVVVTGSLEAVGAARDHLLGPVE